MTRRGKKRLIILITIVLGASIAAVAAHQLRNIRREHLAAEAYTVGMAAYQSGEYEAAMGKLGYAVARGHETVEVLLALGDCRLHVPEENGVHVQRAASIFARAAEIDPTAIEPLNRLIVVYAQLNYITERLDAAQRLLALRSESAAAHKARIESLLQLGRYDDAIKRVDEYLIIAPTSGEAVGLRLAAMTFSGASIESRVQFVTDLGVAHPDSAEIAAIEAATLLHLGRRDEAAAVIDRALSLDVRDTEVLRRLLSTMDMLGAGARADELIERLMSEAATPDPTLTALAVERFWKRNRIDAAGRAIDRLGNDTSDLSDNLRGWHALLMYDGDGSGGAAGLNDAIAAMDGRDTEDSIYWSNLLASIASLDRGDYAVSRERLNAAMTIRPNNDLVHFYHAMINRAVGEFDRAALSLEAAVGIDPTWLNAQILYASTLLDAGRLEQAVEAAGRAFALQPTPGHALLLAQVYVDGLAAGVENAGFTEDALNIFEALRSMAPDDANLRAMHARALLVSGRTERALVELEPILAGEVRPEATQLFSLVDALRVRERPEADALLALMPEESLNDPEVLFRRAIALALDNDEAGALSLFASAIEYSDDTDERFSLRLNEAVFRDQFGLEGASELLIELANERPESAAAQRAVLESRFAWRHDEAIRHSIDRLQALTGDDAIGWMIYDARRLLGSQGDEDAATLVIERLAPVLRIYPDHAMALALTAEAYTLHGDRDRAIGVLSDAVDSNRHLCNLIPRLIGLLRLDGRVAELDERLRDYAARSIPELDLESRRQRILILSDNGFWEDTTVQAESLAARGEPEDEALLAQVYAAQGRTDEALALFKGVVEKGFHDEATIRGFADTLAQSGAIPKGVEALKLYYEPEQPWRTTLAIAQLYERFGGLEQAMPRFAELVDVEDPEARVQLAQFHLRHDDYELAGLVIAEALTTWPNNQTLVATATLVRGLSGEALDGAAVDALSANLVSESSREAFRLVLAADEWYRAHPTDTRGYLDRLNQAVQQFPLVYGCWEALIHARVRAGELDGAVSSASASVRVLPNSAAAARLAAATAVRAERLDLATEFAKKWRALTVTDSMDADLLLAELAWRQDRFDEAYEHVQPYLARLPFDEPSQSGTTSLAQVICLDAMEFEDFESIARTPNTRSETHLFNLLALVGNSRNYRSASEWLMKQHSNILMFEHGRARLAATWFSLGRAMRQQEAFVHTLRTLKSSPSSETAGIDRPTYMFLIAEAQRELGMLQEAQTSYEALLENDPDNVIALNNLALLQLTIDPANAPNAEALAKRALKSLVDSEINTHLQSSVLDTLATAILHQARISDALALYEQAVTADPQSLSPRLGIVESLIALGDLQEAEGRLQAVSALINPDSSGLLVTTRAQRLRTRLTDLQRQSN